MNILVVSLVILVLCGLFLLHFPDSGCREMSALERMVLGGGLLSFLVLNLFVYPVFYFAITKH